LLLSGDPVTGKTTLAKVLINELGIEEFDVLEINASRENGIDSMRERINGFVQTMLLVSSRSYYLTRLTI
jgi:DNA polymerase III delta prime subunit